MLAQRKATHMPANTRRHTYIYTYIYTYKVTYLQIHIHIHIHAYTHAHIHTYTYTHTHIHICIHILSDYGRLLGTCSRLKVFFSLFFFHSDYGSNGYWARVHV